MQNDWIKSFTNLENFDASRTWITFPSTTTNYQFEKVFLLNGAHVAIQPVSTSSATHTVNCINLQGSSVKEQDLMAQVHVGPNQEFFVISSNLYLPIHFHVYDGGLMTFPDYTLLYNSINYVEGAIGGFRSKLTVSYADLHLLATGRSDTEEEPGHYAMTSLEIMTSGNVYANTPGVEYDFSFTSTPTVSGKVSIQTQGYFHARHLTVTCEGDFEMFEGSFVVADEVSDPQTGSGYYNDRVGAGHGGEGGKGKFNWLP